MTVGKRTRVIKINVRTGRTEAEYKSICEAARANYVDKSTISRWIYGKLKRCPNLYDGYIYAIKEEV